MPKKPDAGHSSLEQRAKFEEAARQLGCEEDETAFNEALRRVARSGPRSMPKKAEKPRTKKD